MDMPVDNTEFSTGSAIKRILLTAIREWSLYAIMAFPIILFLGMSKFFTSENIDNHLNRIALWSWIIIATIGVLYTLLIFRISRALINRNLQITVFIGLVIKHSLKMFALFLVAVMTVVFVSSGPGHEISEDNSFISNFPAIALGVLIFISNYGLSSIICTGSSKKSLLIVVKLFLTVYTVYNLLFFVLLFGVFNIGKILPDNPVVAQIVGYAMLAILFVGIPLNTVFLTMIAVNKKLLMVKEN